MTRIALMASAFAVALTGGLGQEQTAERSDPHHVNPCLT
jgi:hypothetical protein